MRFRFVNGKRVPRQGNFVKSNSSCGCSVPNRSYTVAELAERLAKGQPMPSLTFYRNYDDYGHAQVFRPTDLIGVQKLADSLIENGNRMDHLKQQFDKLKETVNVSESKVSTQSDAKED
jgi:hypothetical protein